VLALPFEDFGFGDMLAALTQKSNGKVSKLMNVYEKG
jgi:hypothetical protein